MIDELNKRFNNATKLCMKGISACSPKSRDFLDFTTIKPMLVNYKISEADVQIELMQAKKVRNEHMEDIHDVIEPVSPDKTLAMPMGVSAVPVNMIFSAMWDHSGSLKRVPYFSQNPEYPAAVPSRPGF